MYHSNLTQSSSECLSDRSWLVVTQVYHEPQTANHQGSKHSFNILTSSRNHQISRFSVFAVNQNWVELFIVQKIVKIIGLGLGLGLGWAESERLGQSGPSFFTNLVPDDQPLERMVMAMVLMMMMVIMVMVMMTTKLWTLILTSAILIRARKASTSSRLWNP